MPYIETKTSVPIPPETREILKTRLGQAIALLPGKSEQWLKESLGKLGYDDPGDLFCVEWTPSQGFYVTSKNGDAASDDAAGETVVSN